MRICFFSDIHGNGAAFDAFLQQMEKENPDKIIFGGDICGYYYDSIAIIKKLQQSDIICIRGNHDQMFLECMKETDKIQQQNMLRRLVERYGSGYQHLFKEVSEKELQFLQALPLKWELETDNQHLGFFHGSPRNPLLDRIYPDTVVEDTSAFEPYEYVFSGHTHHKLVKQIGHIVLINPGSAGQQRDGKGTSYVMFDTEKCLFRIQSFSYDREKVVVQIDKYEKDNPIMQEKLKEVLFRKWKSK